MADGLEQLLGLVSAFEKALRALSYYSPDHPVFRQQQEEAELALQATFEALPVFTLGAGGSHLLYDDAGGRLEGRAAQAIATRMFELSVAGIRFETPIGSGGLGRLLTYLAHAPARVRAAGGLAHLLGNTQGVTVMEVDFDRIFRGEVEQLSEFVGEDLVAEAALKDLLRWREAQDDGAAGDEIVIERDAVRTPESLGEFLDDLLDKAEPDAVADPHARSSASRPPGERELGKAEVAELAARAFWSNQRSMTRQRASEQELSQAANHLSSALVRLSPEARFQLLQRMAGQEDDPEDPVAVRRLSEKLQDETIVEAVASALADGGHNDGLARSIGDLIRRLRPVEAQRKRLLDQIARARPASRAGGVLWQELSSRALDQPGLGLLELRAEQTLPLLAQAARARREGKLPPVWGQDVLYSADARAAERYEHEVVVGMLAQGGRCGEGVYRRALALAASLEAARAGSELARLLQVILQRARADGTDPAALQLAEKLFEGAHGIRRAVWLLKQNVTPPHPILILSALEARPSRTATEALIQLLSQADGSELLHTAERHATTASWSWVQNLVRAANRHGAQTGLAVARLALAQGGIKTKEATLKILAETPHGETIGLLAQAAGCAGEKQRLHTLGLLAGDRNLTRLRRAAIGALGLSHSPVAAQALAELLFSTKLFESREDEEIRLSAAQALVTNGSEAARRILSEGAQHRKRAIREICTRVGGAP